MAEEEKQPTPIDPENPPEPIKEIEDKTIRELRDAPVPTEQIPEPARSFVENETPRLRAEREAIEAELNKPIDAIEDTVNALEKEDKAEEIAHPLPHAVSNTTTLLGREIGLPIYTVVYITLGAVTLIEVLISTLPRGIVAVIFLLALSAMKAILVVLFYMHLREDSRIFALALILPLIVALVASLFLLSVPTTGY